MNYVNLLTFVHYVTFANGRIVLTNLPDARGVERMESEREYMEDYGDHYFGNVFSGPLVLEEMDPIPGSPYDLAGRHGCNGDTDPEIMLFWDSIDRDLGRLNAEEDTAEEALYDRLERPRKRRQKPLPEWHYKRWGHGNALELVNRVGQFVHLAA